MRLNNNQELFIKSQEQFLSNLYKKGDITLDELYKLQKLNRDELLDKISKILLKYNIDNSTMNLTTGDIRNEYNSLGKLVKDNIKKEYELEDININNLLNSVGLDKYYFNSFLLSVGIDFKLKKIESKKLQKIIKKKIDGKNYSDRLWDNKNEISKRLQKDIKDFLEGKISVNDIEKIIKQRYNSNTYNTNRLVITEIARVQEGVNSIWMSENFIEYVLYSGTLDSKTCNDCGQYDGQVYEVDKKPVELPKHPKCRCTYIVIPSKDWRPKTRMNNETKEIIDYKSFYEWKKENNL